MEEGRCCANQENKSTNNRVLRKDEIAVLMGFLISSPCYSLIRINSNMDAFYKYANTLSVHVTKSTYIKDEEANNKYQKMIKKI